VNHEDFDHLKPCRICKDVDADRPDCFLCKGTGLVEDLRKYGCCEGHYYTTCLNCNSSISNSDKYAFNCQACALKMKAKDEMAKAPPPPPPTEAQIAQASQSSFMRDLLTVARVFGEAGINGPFTVTLPQLVQGFVTEKNGYRKISIKAGAQFNVDKITMGKKAGLLFCFKPTAEPVADKDNPAWIELEFDDVVNAFGDLADDFDARLQASGKLVQEVNNRLKATINANPSMHKILTTGFERAFAEGAKNAHHAFEEALPGFGQF